MRRSENLYRILIVDDEQVIINGLKKIIHWDEYGIEIPVEAFNGREALEKINEYKPDLMITDIKMPEMDGLSLIKTLRENGSNIKIIIISGYNDFQYVREALKYGVENYITKPVDKEELSSTLISAAEKIQSEAYEKIKLRENEYVILDSILYRLVTNRVGKRELDEKSDLLGIRESDVFFTVAVVKVLKQAEGSNALISEERLLEFAIMNIMKETIGEDFKFHIFFDMNGELVILFHSDTSDNIMEKIERILKNCILNINQYLKTDLFITIGKAQECLDAVHLSYRSASDLLQYFVILPRNYILSSEKSEIEDKKRQEIFILDHDKLKSLILLYQQEEIQRFFDMIYENITKAGYVPMVQINAIAVEVLACFVNTIKEGFVGVEGILENYEELFLNLMKKHTPDNLIAFIKIAALKISEDIKQYGEKPKLLVDKIIDYIHANYHIRDISLKSLSYQFNINSIYLGQILKKRTGELFSDYLNGIRIEKARELLLNTNLKTAEISEKVGYSDPNYFYRVFKKSIGVYPTKYR